MNVQQKGATKPARPAAGDRGKPAPRGDPPPRRRGPQKETGGPVDYDAPRRSEGDADVDSLEALQARAPVQNWAVIDDEDAEAAEEFELPAADLPAEELTVMVVPRQPDEFVCTRCFLVHHHSQLASDPAGRQVCNECTA